MNFEVLDFPWSHAYSKSFVEDEFAKKMNKEFPKWDSPIWDKWGKVFDTEYGYKKMLADKSVMPPSIFSFIEQLESQEFIDTISEATGIDDLLIDDELYGGGLFIHPTGSHLTTHIDFNFNNDIKLYRAVNLLYYMSDYSLEFFQRCTLILIKARSRLGFSLLENLLEFYYYRFSSNFLRWAWPLNISAP